MALNDAYFSVTGYVATQPKDGTTRGGTPTLSFRVGWTPREINRSTGEWADLPSSFASVTCYKKIAEHARVCLRRGDAIVLKGTLRVREYADQAGVRRNSVDITADFLGHDMSKGTSLFNKQRRHTELTAAEFAQSQAAERSPLPGDVAGDRPDAEDADDADVLSGVGAQSETGEPGEVGALGEVGEPEEAELADRDREDEPVGVGR